MRHRDVTLLKRIRRPVGWLVKCCFCCFLFMLFILAVYAVHQLFWGPLLFTPPSAVDPSPFRREMCLGVSMSKWIHADLLVPPNIRWASDT